MLGLSLVDIAVLIAYFGVMIWIGLWASRRIKNQEDYFLGGRNFGKFVQTFAAFGQGTSAENAVGMTVLVHRNGLAGVFQQLINVVTLPVFWVTSVWYRRMRMLTLGDFFEERYRSKAMAAFYALLSAVFFMVVIALGFKAMSRTIIGMTPLPAAELNAEQLAETERAHQWRQLEQLDAKILTPEEARQLDTLRLERPRANFSYLNENWLIVAIALCVVLYAGLGGLEAAFLTDTIQGVFTILLSILLLPFIYWKMCAAYGVSGLGGIIETARTHLPQSAFQIFGSPALADFTWYYMLTLLIVFTLNVGVQANQLVATGSARDEQTARIGFTNGMLIKRVCTLLWGITALLLIVLYGDAASDSDYLWGKATRDLLGMANLGLIGLMMACMLAALMSTADALMLTASGLLTHNLVRWILPGRSERFYVNTGKLAGSVVILGAVLIAVEFQTIFGLLKLLWEFNIVLAASFWLGLKWRRANRIGAWASILSTFILFALLPALIPLLPGAREAPVLQKTTVPRLIETQTTAREIDVERRNRDIADWELLPATEKALTTRPAALQVGDTITQSVQTEKRSVFWTEGLRENADGQLSGQGFLSIELLALDSLGVELSLNPHALNETIRLVIRSLFPFVVLVLVSLLTPADNALSIRQFFAKMRTPAHADKAEDTRQVALSMENPDRFEEGKIWPGSSWEISHPTTTDMRGAFAYTAAAILILLTLYALSTLGKGPIP
jgi:SSS family solute:Na+ symporter